MLAIIIVFIFILDPVKSVCFGRDDIHYWCPFSLNGHAFVSIDLEGDDCKVDVDCVHIHWLSAAIQINDNQEIHLVKFVHTHTIDLFLSIQRNIELTDVQFPVLHYVGSYFLFYFNNHPGMVTVGYPHLHDVAGYHAITSNLYLVSFHFPHLHTVGLFLIFSTNPELSTVEWTDIRNISASYLSVSDNDPLKKFHMPHLHLIGSYFLLQQMQELDMIVFGELDTIGSYLLLSGLEELVNADFPKLQNLGQYLSCTSNAKLHHLQLPFLLAIPEDLGVANNHHLDNLTLCRLNYIGGELWISENAPMLWIKACGNITQELGAIGASIFRAQTQNINLGCPKKSGATCWPYHPIATFDNGVINFTTGEDCLIGSLGCDCTWGGSCEKGLLCNYSSNLCVSMAQTITPTSAPQSSIFYGSIIGLMCLCFLAPIFLYRYLRKNKSSIRPTESEDGSCCENICGCFEKRETPSLRQNFTEVEEANTLENVAPMV